MKRLLTLMLALVMAVSAAGIAFANPYDVTEPITIQWWHAHEEQLTPYLMYMVDRFNEEHPYVTVEPVYIGSYGEIKTQLIAAVASGQVPAIATVNSSEPAYFAEAGILEVLDPYIEAYNYDVEDFGEGLILSTSYEGKQIALPYVISTQVIYYDKTAAEEEGIEMPKTFADMDDFLAKATLFNEDGTTKRYGTVIPGWDHWYYETLYLNNGVKVINDDGMTTDLNGEQSVYITSKLKEWMDKGYAYYAYGTTASSNMRQHFWDNQAFSVFHTSSLYDTYVDQVGDKFEVGMAWLPGSIDGTSFLSEVGGGIIIVPEVASQRQKNAAWQFIMFMTSPEINLYWADKTGYFPTRQSVMGTLEYEEYLERKPEMKNVVSMSSWINPRNQHPAYVTIATEWRNHLNLIFNEDAPIQATLDELAEIVEEILEDY